MESTLNVRLHRSVMHAFSLATSGSLRKVLATIILLLFFFSRVDNTDVVLNSRHPRGQRNELQDLSMVSLVNYST